MFEQVGSTSPAFGVASLFTSHSIDWIIDLEALVIAVMAVWLGLYFRATFGKLLFKDKLLQMQSMRIQVRVI